MINSGAKPSSKSLTDAVGAVAVPISNYSQILESVLKAGAKPNADTYIRIKWYTFEPEHADHSNRRIMLLPDSTVNELFKAGSKPTATELKSMEEDLNSDRDELKRYQSKRSPDSEDRMAIENYKKLVPHFTEIIRRSRQAMSK